MQTRVFFFSMYYVVSRSKPTSVAKRHLQAKQSVINEYKNNPELLSRDWCRLLRSEARKPLKDDFDGDSMYEYWENEKKIEAVNPINLLSSINDSNAESTVETLN